MTWVGVAVSVGSGLYSGIAGNQARQQQKGQIGRQQAFDESRYAALAPYRSAGTQAASEASTPQDFSSDYYDPTNPFAEGGNGQFNPITGGRYSPLVDKAVGTVSNAPDRMALTTQALRDYDIGDAPVFAAEQRQVGQNAARLGRIGAGMTTNDLTGVLGQHERDRLLAGNALNREAISGTLSDRLAQLSALRGANESDIALQQGERAYKNTLGANAVNYRTAQRSAEQGARGAAAGRASALGNLGFNSGGPNYMPMAGFYGNQAGTQEAGVNDLMQYLPYLLPSGNRGAGSSRGATTMPVNPFGNVA